MENIQIKDTNFGYKHFKQGRTTVTIIDGNEKKGIEIREERGENDKGVGILKKLIRVDYVTQYSMLKHGMPKCQGNSEEVILPVDYNTLIERTKIENIFQNGTIPFHLPMCISKDYVDMYIYNSDNGMVVVKHTYSEKYDSRWDHDSCANGKYNVVDYDEMLNFLSECGISLEISKDDAMKSVESRNYRGIKGAINKMRNFLKSFGKEGREDSGER